MKWIDSHTHIYLPEFQEDIDLVVKRSLESGLERLLLPNIDKASEAAMAQLCDRYPDVCLPMMALHPGSVKEDYREELEFVRSCLSAKTYCAIGETGIDLYWDTRFRNEQIECFEQHVQWALEYSLPLVIHSRNSFGLVMDLLGSWRGKGLRGVFHCFTGTKEEASRALDFGFYLGIGGVLTYKNAGLEEVVKHTGLEKLILETDAPYLPPVPCRGKRNEPAYLLHTARRMAEIMGLQLEEISARTYANTNDLFSLKPV